jgi:hypothetical protein
MTQVQGRDEMADLLLGAFVAIAIAFVIYGEIMIKRGRLKRVKTYSYRAALRRSLSHLLAVLAISVLIHQFTNSFEVTVSIAALLLSGVIVGAVFGLLWEYQTKRRGGRKED